MAALIVISNPKTSKEPQNVENAGLDGAPNRGLPRRGVLHQLERRPPVDDIGDKRVTHDTHGQNTGLQASPQEADVTLSHFGSVPAHSIHWDGL